MCTCTRSTVESGGLAIPEIPEVTQIRDKLRVLLSGCQFKDLVILPFKNLLKNVTVEQLRQWILRGPNVTSVKNHSKYLWFETDLGVLLTHFKFTGWWQVDWGETLPRQFIHPTDSSNLSKYARMQIETSKGMLYYTDPRALGGLWLYEKLEQFWEESPHLRLGPTVLSDKFTLEMLTKRCRKPRGRQVVGEVLLEQTTFSGIGNYLRCEILYEACQSPFQRARDISDLGLEVLFSTICSVVKRALDLESYDWWKVFQRCGKPCLREGCAGVIERVEKAGRGIYRCPTCQVFN